MLNRKTIILLSTLLMGSLVLTGCPGPENDEPDPDEGGNGTLVRHDSWNNLMSYDYSNVTVLNEDSMLEEASYVLTLGSGQYIDYYPIFGEWYYQFFADYNGSNYVYWDYTNDGGTAGWLNYNSEYHVDLTLEHQDFYLPNLLNKIHEADVEYSAMMNSFYVKDEALERISNEVFGFAYDHRTFSTIAILVESDENNKDRIQKVRCFDTNDENSPYVQLSFGNYGSTRSQWGFPPLPSSTTVKDYWTITGKTPKVEKYPSTINVTANNINDTGAVVTETGFDLVLEVGDYADLSYLVTPLDVNMSFIVEWTPDRSDFIDNSGNPTGEYANQVALIDIKQNFTERHKYLTALKPGEVNVYATVVFYEYDANDNVTRRTINSNVLKVKVNEPKQIDNSKAVFKFNFTNYVDEYNDQVWGSSSGLFQTRFTAENMVETSTFKPTSRITGYHASLLNSSYTDAYEEVDTLYVVRMNPQGSVNEELASYLNFDLDDQEVSSIAFSFSLHRQNQLTSSFKNNFNTFVISTSVDGTTWTDYDKTTFVKSELMKDEGSLTGMTAHNLELEFDSPVRYVRIAATAKSFTGSFSLVLHDITLSNETKTHVEKPQVAVNSVGIVAVPYGNGTVRVNNSITLACVINPNNATNQNVYWTSSDHTIATVTRNADGTVTVTGLKPGNVQIKVYTEEKSLLGEPHYDEYDVVVLAAATLPTELQNNSYSNETEKVYFTFDNKDLSVTYIKNGVPQMDSLTLTNEVSGQYTFKSSSSEIIINNISSDGMSFAIVSGSNVKGVDLPSVTLTKVSE